MEILFGWDGAITLSEQEAAPAKLPTISYHGMTITIENPKGSIRSGVNAKGEPWQITMSYPYGFIRGTSDFDGEGTDCFVGPDVKAQRVYVIRTRDPLTGSSDENKCMLCFSSPEEARSAFYANYTDSDFFDGMLDMSIEDFKTFLGKAGKRPPIQLDSKAPPPTLYMVRHAHVSDNGTDDISTQIVRGSRDVEPDSQGIAEAERIGEEFAGVPLSIIYTSSKKRARIVADAIARSTGAQVVVDPAAESWNRGELEGQPVAAVLDKMQFYAEHPDEAPPGGESRNAWLAKFGADLRSRLNEAESSGKPIAYVTHLSNILATPAIVTGDRDLLPFPGDKFRTCEMLALTKTGKEWRWKKYVHLSDRVCPIDIAGHRKLMDLIAANIHNLLRDAAPGTRLLAADYIKGFSRTPERLEDLNELLTACMPADTALAAQITRIIRPAFQYGREAVYTERAKFLGYDASDPVQGFNPHNFPAPAYPSPPVAEVAPLGTGVLTPIPPPELQTPWAPAVAGIGKRAAFDFAAWTLSREMAQGTLEAEDEEVADPQDQQEFNLEADMLQQALGAAGLPLRQLSREIASVALCEGRRQALRELKDDIQCLSLTSGLPAAIWR